MAAMLAHSLTHSLDEFFPELAAGSTRLAASLRRAMSAMLAHPLTHFLDELFSGTALGVGFPGCFSFLTHLFKALLHLFAGSAS